MARIIKVLARVLVVSLFLSSVAVADLTLVDKGRSDYVVVLDDNASRSEKWAAQEFIDHVEKMSGVRLAMAAPEAALPAKAVLIGAERLAASLGVKKDSSLGDEGFVIRTVGDRLVIAGGKQRGTMYGVYTFLEHLGCRWWTPSESTIPSLKTIVMGPLDIRQTPKLQTRNIMYAEGHNPANHLWYVRNKLNGIGWNEIDERYGGGSLSAGLQAHCSIDYVESSVEEMKPEMWALVKGSRTHDEICPTNSDVIKATVKSMAKTYRENPGTPYLVLAHEDNDAACQCETCSALAEREGRSAIWWHFVNKVAERLAKEVPGARIQSGAYGWSRPPLKTMKLQPNIIVRFAPIESDYAHPLADASNPENAKVKEDITAWSRVAPAMMIWTYVGNRAHYLMPNPDLDSLVPNIKFFADHKAIGITEQGTHVGAGTEFVPLRMWVQARALWNPDADGKALIAEFLEAYYGPAASAVAEYIDIMHRYGREHNYHLGRVTRMNAPFLQPEIIAEAEELLRKADGAAKGNPDFERRVRHAHMPIWYVLTKRGPLSRTWQATEKRVGKLDFAEMAAQLNRVAKDYGITAVADPENAEPFFQWLTDYGRLVAEKSAVLPPELDMKDFPTTRLLQARQIDSGWLARTGWWVRDEAASDGWALKVPTAKWLIQHHFSRYEECAGAKRFKLFIRVRGGKASGEGKAFVCGTRGDILEVTAEQLADGKYHVFEVGEFDVTDDMMTYIALSRPSVMNEVYLDCLWLQPVK
ncbi:MAG: DUF4838 domain-containing protein [Planctomycetes bacterium]|nr:DUF4838 domain-containing protein [Planctomycetota bacterium]